MGRKFGVTVIDGKIIDLDNTSIEELEVYEKKLEEEIETLEKNVDKLLGVQ